MTGPPYTNLKQVFVCFQPHGIVASRDLTGKPVRRPLSERPVRTTLSLFLFQASIIFSSPLHHTEPVCVQAFGPQGPYERLLHPRVQIPKSIWPCGPNLVLPVHHHPTVAFRPLPKPQAHFFLGSLYQRFPPTLDLQGQQQINRSISTTLAEGSLLEPYLQFARGF